MDPEIDFSAFIREAGLTGVLDPESIEVADATSGKAVPHALSQSFAHGDCGRVEFVIADPLHGEYEIRFRVVGRRPPSKPRRDTPLIGTGDLLRFGTAEPQPVVLAYSMALHDINADGRPDLLGTWNYFRRPGEASDAVVAYPGVIGGRDLEFGELVPLYHVDSIAKSKPKGFDEIYASTDFADLNRDGLLDLVYVGSKAGKAAFFLNTGRRDASGMPEFEPAGAVAVTGWQACQVVDLNGDGALDLVVDGTFIQNTNPQGWPFKPAAPVKLDAGRQPCFLDIDRDGRLDAICLQGAETLQPNFYGVAWRQNLGGSTLAFGDERLLEGVDPPQCSAVAVYSQGAEQGLIVQHDALQSLSFYRLTADSKTPRFEPRGSAAAMSTPISLGDQATPCLCDWDADGDLDLLVGGGHGWPRILLNEGTRTRPAFSEPRFILAGGKPIRFVRNEILGEPHHWHDMGYTFPVFEDWDGDGRRDLIFPNETNRIFWYPNVGTPAEPRFEERRQILCDGYPDSAELRQLSARRSNDPKSTEGAYPREKEQPFFWRTGAAVADFNGDGLMDLATLDGQSRNLTLFAQHRDGQGALRLQKGPALLLADGRSIDDRIVDRTAHWTESFRAADWDQDGLLDLLYSVAGAHRGTKDGGSIYLLKNVGSKQEPRFAPPQTMRCFGQPMRFTNHGPHPWPGDLDGDGKPDLLGYVEWSVYPFFSHAALMMNERPRYSLKLMR